MIILITGASHTGKTALAQKLLEKYQYPYLSIDHLKMGLIRSGNTELTPMDDKELTEYGKIVDRLINTIPRQSLATIDRYVIMPNHIHLVIMITDSDELRAIRESPLRGRSVISKMIGYIKMNASKEIHNRYGNEIVWQRGFHDHIIRNRNDYEKISKYIYENPIIWQYDCFYTEE